MTFDSLGLPANEVDTWFAEINAKRSSTEFIWVHPDVSAAGLVNRLVLVEDMDITAVCYP